MNRSKDQRPRPAVLIAVVLLTLAGVLAMNALPALRTGVPVGQALGEVLRDREFWTGQVLPLSILMLLMMFVFPLIYSRVLRDRNTGGLSWSRNRLLVTFGGLVFILGTAVPIIANTLSGARTYGVEQLAFTGVMWLLYGWMIVRMWVQKPSPEWKESFETGNHSRSMDERYRLVLGKSAVTTLYWSLGLVFVGGSLYDILVTRTWPVRSIAEFTIILVLWTTIMNKVNREV